MAKGARTFVGQEMTVLAILVARRLDNVSVLLDGLETTVQKVWFNYLFDELKNKLKKRRILKKR